MSDSVSREQAALHAEVAARLRRAGGLNGSSSGSTIGTKRPNNSSNISRLLHPPSGGSSNGNGNGNGNDNSSSNSVGETMGSVADHSGSSSGSGGGSAASRGGGRKLLHWTAEQWRQFEAAPRYAKVMPTAKFLPIRAPLSSLYEIHYASDRSDYTPSSLMEKLLASTRSGPVVNVGLVIDATGSDYYLYDPKEWEDWDVKYVKLSTIIPEDADSDARREAEERLTVQFFEQVEKHKGSAMKDMDVMVYGSFGYNLVGFLTVRYMIEYCGVSLNAALKEFADALPPGLYSPDHLEAESHVNTLIDGIIVEDEDHDHKVARYLAFDLVFLEGAPVWQKKLEKRLQCLQNEIILPRKNDQTFDYTKEPFRVRMKDHFRLAKAEFLLTKFVKDVTHEVDGVIFTPTEAPYNLGGFENDDPVFKFVASEGNGIPGLDGSIPQRRLLQYIQTVPPK
ncbi:hypothetical protein P43SY_000226 [Pythium insidiosum]|uniref:mRNA capping enzyme adenylation domain-containing protein n=1 Tax=Pythium insidiosum TaxID=114742 RepID=A0AAD5MAI8_PYTIN|nr:hypothetical protein P43SY_000226 [Pythium insidiosum]